MQAKGSEALKSLFKKKMASLWAAIPTKLADVVACERCSKTSKACPRRMGPHGASSQWLQDRPVIFKR